MGLKKSLLIASLQAVALAARQRELEQKPAIAAGVEPAKKQQEIPSTEQEKCQVIQFN
jgi:hypothetical protein